MIKIQLFLTSCLLVCFSINANLFGQPSQQEIASLVDELYTDQLNSAAPGAAVLVVKDGKTIFSKGYGMANLDYEIPITPTTVFDLASLAKQFTGYAIAKLVEEGKIKLEDDVRKYIPEFPDFDHVITVNHLVHHTSGLRDWTSTLPLAGWSFNDVIKYDQILRMVYAQKSLNFLPGEQYVYSNSGYNVLAEIIQRVTGLPFETWAEQNIFEPLGMQQTLFAAELGLVIPNRALGYEENDQEQYRSIPNNLLAKGSSSIFSSTEDLAKWVNHLLSPPAKDAPIVNRLFERGTFNDGEVNDYAFGIEQDDWNGTPFIAHSGGWAAFSTYLALLPAHNMGIVVLHNYDSRPYRTVSKITELLLPSPAETEEEEALAEKSAAPTATPAAPLTALDDYLGTYKLGRWWYVTITRKDDQLWTQATQEDNFPMTAVSEDLFRVAAYGDRTMAFIRDQQGKVIKMEYADKMRPKMLQPSSFNPSTVKDYLGTYHNEELAVTYEIIEKDGELKFRHFRHGEIDLKNAWDEEFVGEKFFLGSVEFTEDEAGQISGFHTSNYRARKQWFARVK